MSEGAREIESARAARARERESERPGLGVLRDLVCESECARERSRARARETTSLAAGAHRARARDLESERTSEGGREREAWPRGPRSSMAASAMSSAFISFSPVAF